MLQAAASASNHGQCFKPQLGLQAPVSALSFGQCPPLPTYLPSSFFPSFPFPFPFPNLLILLAFAISIPSTLVGGDPKRCEDKPSLCVSRFDCNSVS